MSTYTKTEIESSILLTIKKMIGFDPDYEPFDTDIAIHITSQMANLYQLGVNAAKNCVVTDASTQWSDLLNVEDSRLQFVKTYIYAKVKMIFDPDTSTAKMQALKDAASEAEFRISVAIDKPYDDIENPSTPSTPVTPSGTSDHTQLINRDKADQHPISAITNLGSELGDKLDEDDYMTPTDIDKIIARYK